MRSRGPKRKLTPKKREQLLKFYRDRPDMPVPDVARRFGVSKSTVYNLIAESQREENQ